MSEINEERLNNLSVKTLDEILKQAEAILKSNYDTESVLNTKILAVLQVIVPSIIALVGFLISRVIDNKIDILFAYGISVCFVIIYSSYFLYKSMEVKNVGLAGFSPNVLVDLIENHQLIEADKIEFLLKKEMIIDLSININNCKETNRQRSNFFKRCYEILIKGIIITTIFFALHLVVVNLFGCNLLVAVFLV